ncbi:MAG: hypothetical protein AB8G96_13875, partial [Phycisphaerales bacterium]
GRDLRLLLGDGSHVVSSLTVREIDHVRLVDPGRRPERIAGGTGARELRPLVPSRMETLLPARGAVRHSVHHAVRSTTRSIARATPRPTVHRVDRFAPRHSFTLASFAQASGAEAPAAGDANDASAAFIPPAATRPGPSDAAKEQAVWYRAVFADDVRIVRGEGDEAVDATADELHIVFSEESDGAGFSGGESDGAPGDDLGDAAASTTPAASVGPLPPRAMLMAAAMSIPPSTELTFAPPPHPSDTVVTCTGELRLRPMTDTAAMPAATRNARLELRARPGGEDVRLTDAGSEIVALARVATYESPEGRIDLHGRSIAAADDANPATNSAANPAANSAANPTATLAAGGEVHISGPEFDLRGPRVRFSQANGTGGVDGAGRLWFAPAADEARPDANDDARSVEVTWTRGVDLTFAANADDNAALENADVDPDADGTEARSGARSDTPDTPDTPGSGLTGALAVTDLERATFDGDVRVVAASGLASTGRNDRTTAGEADGGAWIDASDPSEDVAQFSAASLDLTFAPGPDGQAAPRRVVGRGSVVARVDARRIAADDVDAVLMPQRVLVADTDTDTSANAGPKATSRIALDRVTARGAVELQFEGGRRALADTMTYASAGGIATLVGQDVQLHDPDAILDRARRLVIEQEADRATVEGPGRVRRFAARRAASVAEAAGAAGPPAALATPEPDLDATGERTPELTLAWTEQLVIQPAADDVRRIEVQGSVTADAGAAGFRGADRLVAELALDPVDSAETNTNIDAPAGSATAAERDDASTGPRFEGRLRRIMAAGRVVAFDREAESELAADTIDLQLVDDAAGDPRPERLIAGGTVAVSGPGRRFWSDDLIVEFADAATVASAGGLADQPATSDDAASRRDPLAGADVERIDATGDVEVRLADGRRILGDQLEAVALDGDARITGNLLVAGPDLLLTGPRAVQIRRNGDDVSIEGGGRFRQLPTPMRLAAGDQRSDSRTIRESAAAIDPSLDVSWTTSAAWTRLASRPGSGRELDTARLVLVGGVDAVAEPDPRERSTLQADRLELTFRDLPSPAAPADANGRDRADDAGTAKVDDQNAEQDAAPDTTSDSLTGGRRELQRMIARGGAKLRTYAWLRDDRADLSRLLAITADDIDWDQARGVATVDVPGELLIRDLREDDAAGPNGPAAGANADARANSNAGSGSGSGVDFGPQGDTKFTWTESLRMRPGAGRTTDITLNGSVRVIHRSLEGKLATLDAGTVTASVDRVVGPASAARPAGPPANADDPATLAFGGPVDLRRLTASDRVRVDVAPRNVACEGFVYDPATGIARMTSRPGSAISIEDTTSNGDPTRINGAAVWDLRNDTIVVDGASGRGGR